MTTADGSIRILIADDHPFVRDGITALVAGEPDMTVVGEAADGVEAFSMFETLRPDVLLIDLQMPRLDGFGAIERVRRIDPDAVVVVLTTYPGDGHAVRALRAGASAYLLKTAIRKELLTALRAAHAGRRTIDQEVAQELAQHVGDDRLTARETEVLTLVARGRANKEIARSIEVSVDTIKADLKSIFVKLDVDDRTLAAMVALRRGLIGL